MNGKEAEPATDTPQASGAQEQEAQDQELATMFSDIVILCHPRNVSNLVQSFEDEIKHAAGELPLFVLWSGVTGVLHQGIVVLECEGRPSAAFLHNLSIDHEIFDYAVYDWRKSEGTQESASEKEEQSATSQESGKATERPFV